MSQLDLVFVCDCTGSMGSYIRSAQDNIRGISAAIRERAKPSTSIRFGLIKYRDHPPQDSTYVTQVHPFTESIDEMKAYVDTMAADGGGDGPEAVSAALHEVTQVPWRPNATKVCVLIADAPPHGLGESGDGFPDGCPMGTDPVVSCQKLAALGVVVYSVGVEPILSSSYRFARDFMIMVAKCTEGKFLPLGKAEILANVIVSGTLEGMNMKEVWDKLEAEVETESKLAGIQLGAAEKVDRVSEKVATVARELKMEQVDVANPYMENYDAFNCDVMMKCSNLKEAQKKLDPSRNAQVQQQVQSYHWAGQEAMCVPAAPMTAQQECRMVNQAKKKAGFFSF